MVIAQLKQQIFYRLSPHSGQNFAFVVILKPQPGQLLAVLSFAPHSGQNFALVANGASHSGQLARTVSLQLPSLSFLSSSDILACAQTSSTERLACAADISTPKSGAHSLQSPRLVFQQLFRQTQEEQRGH